MIFPTPQESLEMIISHLNMQADILVVDDDMHRATALKDSLRLQGYTVCCCPQTHQLISQLSCEIYDLIVIQVDQDCSAVQQALQFLQSQMSTTPVFVTVSSASPQERVKILQLGTCDCISIPYHPQELELRIKNVLKRLTVHSQSIVQTDHFSFNTETGEVQFAWGTVLLRKKEFLILSLLLQHRNQIVPKEHMIEKIWSLEQTPIMSTIDVHIRRMRIKFRDQDKKIIITAHGVGYKVSG